MKAEENGSKAGTIQSQKRPAPGIRPSADESRPMARVHEWLRPLPVWLPTILVVLAILWLTLAPHPVGDMQVMWFEGEDKIFHGIMFFALCFMVLLDLMRQRKGALPTLPAISAIVFASAAFGVGIEFLQERMDAGRTFELYDMVADFVGAVLGGGGWLVFEYLYLLEQKHKQGEAEQDK